VLSSTSDPQKTESERKKEWEEERREGGRERERVSELILSQSSF